MQNAGQIVADCSDPVAPSTSIFDGEVLAPSFVRVFIVASMNGGTPLRRPSRGLGFWAMIRACLLREVPRVRFSVDYKALL
jgi:hypothetical protein